MPPSAAPGLEKQQQSGWAVQYRHCCRAQWGKQPGQPKGALVIRNAHRPRLSTRAPHLSAGVYPFPDFKASATLVRICYTSHRRAGAKPELASYGCYDKLSSNAKLVLDDS
ncbi:hypothetical protein TREES_T100017105 [Tupaia chinensis]|uniref:Uncharacterized protein n=1 Tax=Tupaia chinensis TaxID=246437 RepID=L9KPX8_TUPCH|nr:hypothetical protein TREES_T100017105 [Tupaia chinensis]